ncbi:hypothetical protein JCM10908_002006 [Rhodotorula pacifica]|uniref:DNA-directed RNA polymerase III subunit RPC4 n=1 Tax=Rhodotorula pacifica TaxID=1495444 RepID=UPI00316FD52E
MSGRGRGRGRRVAAQTLSGAADPTPANGASPSPAPERSAASSRASSAATSTPAPGATDDAPNDTSNGAGGAAGRGDKPRPGGSSSGIRRMPSVGVGSTRAPSVGLLARTPSIGPQGGSGTLRERPVGGLLGSTSEFRPSANAGAAGGSGTGKAKFKPNMKRRDKVLEQSDDEDVKMEDGNGYRGKRPPRAPRPRQELEMTASGPMAQGPGGPPKAWGARPAPGGSSGAAVMAASRAGTLNQMLDADSDASDLEVDDDPLDETSGALRFKAVDLNDIGSAQADETTLPPLTLPRDPKVVRTKIRRLQARKTERLKKEARTKAKSEGALAGVKPEPGDDSLPTSTTATPAPIDSKEGSLALFSVDEEKEAKDLRDLEQEEKKEIILSEAFDLAPEARGELYMFQFPRKFPNFVPSKGKTEDDTSMADLSLADNVKADPDAPPPRRKAAPPPWGRFGTRQEKAARWSEHAGRIGELCVHQSGKVTLRLAGDLRYEVLPAAQPSFLQEIAVLDHPSRRPPAAAANGSKSRHHSESEPESDDQSSNVSLSDLDGSASDDDEEKKDARREKKQARQDKKNKKKKKPAQEIPADSLVLLGQTSKKFIVVPDMQDLLDKVGQEERAEKEAERKAKLEKANRPAAIAKKREGTAAPRR